MQNLNYLFGGKNFRTARFVRFVLYVRFDFIPKMCYNKFMRKKTDEELRRLQELRRSSAATPLRNKKNYSRKVKHKNLTRSK